MAGLLGDFLGDPLTQLGAGLLGGTSPFFGVNAGNAVAQTAVMQQAMRKEQRAQDQAELSQLVQSYKILQDQDMQSKRQAYLTGTPYQQNPLLQVHEQKLAQLLGRPPGGQPPSAAPQSVPPQMAPQGQPQAMPSAGPPQGSMGPMPQTQSPQQQPPQAPQQDMSMPQLLQGAGITPAQAMIWSGTEKGTEQMMARLSEVYGPRVVNNVLMQLQPNGQTKFLGGAVSGDTLPVVNGAGGLQVQQIKGLQDARAAQAGATEAATQQAKAPYEMVSVPQSDGSTRLVPKSSLVPQQGGSQAPQAAGVTVTQGPRAGSGASFGTSQTPGGRTQQEDLAKFHTQTFVDTQLAGRSAAKGLQNLDRIDQLMQGVDTGALTPKGMQVAAYAQAMGFQLDPKLPNKQAAEALSGQIALELRNPSGGAGMPGALSDNDLKFLRSMTPGLAQTTKGRQEIIETKRKILQRDQEVAQFARDYRAKTGGNIDDGFTSALQAYSQAHPLFAIEAPAAKPGGWSIQKVD